MWYLVCLCNDSAETLQSGVTCFVWVEHSHRVPKELLSKKMWDCWYIRADYSDFDTSDSWYPVCLIFLKSCTYRSVVVPVFFPVTSNQWELRFTYAHSYNAHQSTLLHFGGGCIWEEFEEVASAIASLILEQGITEQSAFSELVLEIWMIELWTCTQDITS
jgi:hypothetical protein